MFVRTALTYALARLTPLGLDFPAGLDPLPTVTLATLVVVISAHFPTSLAAVPR